jgi:hypothetical protein
MSDLAYRQSKIQEKRKTTPWREFVMEICSRMPSSFYKNSGLISRYPESDRIRHIVKQSQFEENRDSLAYLESTGDFFFDFSSLFMEVPHGNVLHYALNENSDFSDVVL